MNTTRIGSLWRVWLLAILALALVACTPASPTAEPTPTPHGDPLVGQVLTWRREGGIAGFCDELHVFADGRVVAGSCKGGGFEPVGEGMLTAEQQAQLLAWLDRFQSFELARTDPATADAMTIRVAFAGRGTDQAAAGDQEAIQSFAALIFAPMSVQAQMPTPTPQVFHPLPARDRAFAAAREALAKELGVDALTITLVAIEQQEWPDGCLGLPREGEMCIQQITPGWRVVLNAGTQTYEYRTDGQGDQVRLSQGSDSPVATLTPQPVPPLDPGAAYHRIEIGETGLSVEIPSGWLRLEPEWLWTPTEESALRLGIHWAELTPPAEAEAVLLPNHAQVLDSSEVSLSWGTGRAVTLEVYAPAVQGGGKARVEAVERHVLVVVNQDGVRRGYDLYARAPDETQLAALSASLEHMVESSLLASATH